MTARERILTLLNGKPVDRPPAMPITMMWAADLIGAKYHDYATRAEVQAWMKSKGAAEYMAPAVVVVLETMPLLGSGKTDYVELSRIVRDRLS